MATAVASSQAAAGARTHAGMRLRCSGKETEWLGGTYGAAEARRSDRSERRGSRAWSSSAMADDGVGCLRGGG